MKLVTFSAADKSEQRLGVVVEGIGEYAMVADVNALQALLFTEQERAAMLPPAADMLDFLRVGEQGIAGVTELLTRLRDRMTAEEGSDYLYRLDEVNLYAPIARPEKILCIGLNYRDHCAEQNKPIPASPMLFAKYSNTIIGPGAAIVIPPITQAVDYETELAVVIGKPCKGVSEADALSYVGGYMIMNDVTARDFQRQDGQFTRSKTQDTFGPCGPHLVTPDEIPDPQNLRVEGWVNGELRQHSNTEQMVFGVAYLISYLSAGISLEVGDIISTGTPGGVGEHMKPPAFLKAGDVVTMEIEGLGRLENTVQ